jgi:hypothetical protein
VVICVIYGVREGQKFIFFSNHGNIFDYISQTLPSEMTTFDPNNISFVFGLSRTEQVLVKYVLESQIHSQNNPGVSAIIQGYIVEIIDFNNKIKVGTKTIWGPEPPDRISDSSGNKGELPKINDIYNYLVTLPYNP